MFHANNVATRFNSAMLALVDSIASRSPQDNSTSEHHSPEPATGLRWQSQVGQRAVVVLCLAAVLLMWFPVDASAYINPDLGGLAYQTILAAFLAVTAWWVWLKGIVSWLLRGIRSLARRGSRDDSE